MKALLFLGLGLSTVTAEYVSGYNNATTIINVNGTNFWIYSSNFPLSDNWIPVRDYCTPVASTTTGRGNATSCSSLGTNYCCGKWHIDPWYQNDISNRLTYNQWGSNYNYQNPGWYARSYFNQYSGYHC